VERVARALGTSVIAAAEGVHRVVNTNMAEGIRLVSVRRGADPRRFTLLSFGGAAGLHITEVARMLEIGRVVVPRVAAVLSAWGMLATDLRYEFVRTHVGEAQQVGAERLRRLFAEMEAEGRSRMAKAFSGPISVRRAVDMRYGEQTFEITVALDGVDLAAPDLMDQVVARFHRRHEELYTYSAPGQEAVLVNARLAVVGELPTLPVEGAREAGPAPAPPRTRRVYLRRWVDVPVYDLEALRPGDEIKGAAIFESPTTTIVIRPGERALITPQGWLDIRLG
jgi:N-methylhydantoinase A